MLHSQKEIWEITQNPAGGAPDKPMTNLWVTILWKYKLDIMDSTMSRL